MEQKWPARLAHGAWRGLREAAGGIIALSIPGGCRVCERLLEEPSRLPICPECLASFRPLHEPLCQLCGRQMVPGAQIGAQGPVCALCRRGVYGFDVARSYAAYDDALLLAVVLLKQEAIRPLAAWFAARLEEVVRKDGGRLAADVVVPVPLHPDRRRERGHNQAEMLAQALARRLGLPLEPRALVRGKPRPAKLKLSRHERWSAARGAYAAAPVSRIDKRRVLLVDDVFTTGATLDACARALRTSGASRVAALTVARVVDAWPVA
jgi:ComF family protein